MGLSLVMSFAEVASMPGTALAPLLGGVLLDTIGAHHAAMWLAIASIGGAQTLCFLAFVRCRTMLHPPRADRHQAATG